MTNEKSFPLTSFYPSFKMYHTTFACIVRSFGPPNPKKKSSRQVYQIIAYCGLCSGNSTKFYLPFIALRKDAPSDILQEKNTSTRAKTQEF